MFTFIDPCIPTESIWGIGLDSTQGTKSESDRWGIESKSTRGIELESARGTESIRDTESESDHQGVESEYTRCGIGSDHCGIKSDRHGIESDHCAIEPDCCGIESYRGNKSIQNESTSIRGDKSTFTLQIFCSCAEGCEYMSIYQYWRVNNIWLATDTGLVSVLGFTIDAILISTLALYGYWLHINSSLAVNIGLTVDFSLVIILAICHSWYTSQGSDRSFEVHPLAWQICLIQLHFHPDPVWM